MSPKRLPPSRSRERRPGAGRALVLGLFACLLTAAVGCTGESSDDSAAWLRQPLEVGFVPGDPPHVLYTATVDSRDTHDVVLQVAGTRDEIAFELSADSDANGNAPDLPGEELTSAYWLWAPSGLVTGDRSHALVLQESKSGDRQVTRVTWSDDPASASAGAVSGSNGAVAYAAAPCGADVCVVLARASEVAGPTTLVLSRFDETGDKVGDPATVATLDGIVRSLGVVTSPIDAAAPDAGTRLDVFAVTCEGCGDIHYDTYEDDIYGVTSRIAHVSLPADPATAADDAEAPETLLEWGGTIEPAKVVNAEGGAELLYYRTAAPDAPGCSSQGHCPVDRDLVLATWTRADGAFTEDTTIATSEVEYQRDLVRSAGRLWALWRVRGDAQWDPRDLQFAELTDGAVGPAETITTTYVPFILRDQSSQSPAALPFDYVDGLATLGTADEGPWVALRFRDLTAPGAKVCGEVVRTGIWTGRLGLDGLVTVYNTDPDTLAREADCGSSTCAAAPAAGAPVGATSAALLLLLLVGAMLLRSALARRA